MSSENTKTEGQPVEPTGKLIMKFLQNNRNGATIADVVRHLRTELRCPDTEQLSKAVEKVMENGVAIGFLHKNGVQYYAWNPVENVRQRVSKRSKGAKKRKRTEDDAEGHSNRSDEDADSGRRSLRSDDDGKGTQKRRADNNGEKGHRRRATKKETQQNHSDEEVDPPRRQRRRRPRPAAAPAECYCYAWTPRRRQYCSFSSNSSRSSLIAD